MLDTPDSVGDLNRVAEAVLILEDDVETGNDVTDEVLGTETDGEAGEPGDGGDGSDVNAELLRGDEESQSPDNFAAGTVDDGGESARLLLAGQGGFALRAGGLDDEFGEQLEQVVDEECDDENAEQVEKIREGEGRELR